MKIDRKLSSAEARDRRMGNPLRFLRNVYHQVYRWPRASVLDPVIGILAFRNRLTLVEFLALAIGRTGGQRPLEDVHNDRSIFVAGEGIVTARLVCVHPRPKVATLKFRNFRTKRERRQG